MKLIHSLVLLSLLFTIGCSPENSNGNSKPKKKKTSKHSTDEAFSKRIIGQWEKMLSPEFLIIKNDGTFGRYGIAERAIGIDLDNVIEKANWKLVEGRLELSYKDGKKKYLDIQMDEYIDEDLDDFLILGNYDSEKYPNREDFEHEFTYMRAETAEEEAENEEMLRVERTEALIGRWQLNKEENLGFIFKEDGTFERLGKGDEQDFYQLAGLPQKGTWELEQKDVILFIGAKGNEFAEMIYWHTEELFYIGDIYEDVPSEYKSVDDFMAFNGWKKAK